MEELANVISKLERVSDLLGPDALNFPQVVAVGDQSSGKSSVVESLVGKSFLPKGNAIATRRPLVIHLTRTADNELKDSSAEYAVFEHSQRIYTNFDEIHTEITEETTKKAGTHKAINVEPIVLKIFSNKVTTLTLIDLPGIVKVPVGDQPSNVEEMVESLVVKYISNPDSIILAVVAASTDMTTCECIKLAKKVDPNFDRTLVVVTKLDLMDAGTNAFDILSGNIIPVKLGIIGVVNRSHLQAMEGKNVQSAIIDEASYLRSAYPQIAHQHGIPYLLRTINLILLRRIQKSVPLLRQKIKSYILYYEQVLSTMGDSTEDPKKSLLEIISRYASTYCNKITGCHNELETQELTGGARISYVFSEIYGKTLRAMDPLENLSREAIVTAVRNSSGIKPPFFVPSACFETLVKRQIEKLEAPSLNCVQLISDELERVVIDIGPQLTVTMSRFPKLQSQIRSIISCLIKSRIEATSEMVRNLVRIHCSYINTTHPDFVRDKVRILAGLNHEERPVERRGVPMIQMRESTGPSIPEGGGVAKECIVVENLIISYFSVVKRSVQDTVPKAIMHFMVNHVMEMLPSTLISQLYNNENASVLLEESQAMAQRRREITNLLEAYRKAEMATERINSDR